MKMVCIENHRQLLAFLEEQNHFDEIGLGFVFFNENVPEEKQVLTELRQNPKFLNQLPHIRRLQFLYGSDEFLRERAECCVALLSEKKCAQGLELLVTFASEDFHLLQTCIQSGQYPAQLTLQIRMLTLDPLVFKAFMLSLKNKKEDLKGLRLELLSLSAELIEFVKTVTDDMATNPGRGIEKPMIDISFSITTSADVKPMCFLLEGRSWIHSLHIDCGSSFDGPPISGEIFKKIVETLKKNHSPLGGVSVSLDTSDCSDQDAMFLAEAIATGQFPENTSWRFTLTRLSDAGTIALIKAMQSDQCPENLGLHLDHNELSHEGILAISTAFADGVLPRGIELAPGFADLTTNTRVFRGFGGEKTN